MGTGQVVLIVVLAVVAVILIIVGWIISTINAFRRMIVKIDESESGIDVQLTKRFDLLTKMVQATKGYAKHEQETLSKVIAMRNPGSNATLAEKTEFANQLTQGLASLNVVVERYPELKASEQFTNLQRASVDVEENLQAARRVYNANVSHYNQKIVVFPASMIANWKGFTKRDFFEAEATKREDVKFDF